MGSALNGTVKEVCLSHGVKPRIYWTGTYAGHYLQLLPITLGALYVFTTVGLPELAGEASYLLGAECIVYPGSLPLPPVRVPCSGHFGPGTPQILRIATLKNKILQNYLAPPLSRSA